jgi:F-box and WD-40 domain protein CDC4
MSYDENCADDTQILDFGAVRDGKPLEELGKRKLLNEAEVQQLIAEEA